MGLDIYAGTLTRYYSHNWKTVVQQWAEENGYSFNRITPDGEPADNEEELSPAEVQAAMLFGMGLVFLPFALRALPLPEELAHRKVSLYVGIELLLLLALFGVACLYLCISS